MHSLARHVSGTLIAFVAVGAFGCQAADSPPPAQVSEARVLAAPAGQVFPTSELTRPRAAHTATLLADGRVLVAGGMEGAGTSAELFELVPEKFVPTGALTSERSGHSAVLLPNGKVLLAGGWAGPAVSRSAEIYDPATGTFAATGAMHHARSGYTATLLPGSGQVLLIGGFDGNERLASAELYDPQSGTFASTGAMGEARAEFASALLADGRVLVAGGNRARGEVLASAEIYDPASGSFAPTADMTIVRHKHAATALADGRVLVTGGSDPRDGRGQYASAEIYDPGKGRFTAVGDMGARRFKIQRAVVLLPNGEVLLAGGAAQAELYEPSSNTFRPAKGSLGAALAFTTATALKDGRVLIVGGYDPSIQATASAWLYR